MEFADLLAWADQGLQVSASAERVWTSLLLWAFTRLCKGPLRFLQAGAAGLIFLFFGWAAATAQQALLACLWACWCLLLVCQLHAPPSCDFMPLSRM
jgi:hypothetical protein